MIADNIKNRRLYETAHPLFSQAFDFIKAYLAEPKPAGKYELLGDALFAMVQEYDSKTEAKMEVHDKYIDLQFVAEGEEKILWAQREELDVLTPFAEGKDAAFLSDGDRPAALHLRAGDFAIFYPSDAHKPGLAVNAPTPVKKIVVKISVS